MTEHTNPMLDDTGNRDDMDDIELITSFLNGQLEPERLEAIRRRLEEDADFRELAAPLLLAWSVPRHIERKPRPAGEMERDWAEFKRRVGFGEPPPPPPKPKRRWRRALVLFVFLIGAYVLLATNQEPTIPGGPYTEIPFQIGWVSLDDGIEVNVAPGSSLRVDHQPWHDMKRVLLDGSARFRVLAFNPEAHSLRTSALLVETPGGSVIAGESDFTITTRADTTLVLVLPLGPRRALAPQLRTVTASTELTKESRASIGLLDNERARLVRGQEPETFTRRLP